MCMWLKILIIFILCIPHILGMKALLSCAMVRWGWSSIHCIVGPSSFHFFPKVSAVQKKDVKYVLQGKFLSDLRRRGNQYFLGTQYLFFSARPTPTFQFTFTTSFKLTQKPFFWFPSLSISRLRWGCYLPAALLWNENYFKERQIWWNSALEVLSHLVWFEVNSAT